MTAPDIDELRQQVQDTQRLLAALERSMQELRQDVVANTTALHGSSRFGMTKGLIMAVELLDQKLDGIQQELEQQRKVKEALEQAQERTWKQLTRVGTATGLVLGLMQLANIIIQLAQLP